jgi:hypothetical protein
MDARDLEDMTNAEEASAAANARGRGGLAAGIERRTSCVRNTMGRKPARANHDVRGPPVGVPADQDWGG